MTKSTIRSLAVLFALGFAGPAMAQTANSSGGAGSATQPSAGGAGAANGQNAQLSSGGTTTGASKIGAPTAVEQQEQQKSDKDTQICKGC